MKKLFISFLILTLQSSSFALAAKKDNLDSSNLSNEKLLEVFLKTKASQLDADWVKAAQDSYQISAPTITDLVRMSEEAEFIKMKYQSEPILKSWLADIRKPTSGYPANVCRTCSGLEEFIFHVDTFLRLVVNGYRVASTKEWLEIAAAFPRFKKNSKLKKDEKKDIETLFSEELAVDIFIQSYERLGSLNSAEAARVVQMAQELVGGGKSDLREHHLKELYFVGTFAALSVALEGFLIWLGIPIQGDDGSKFHYAVSAFGITAIWRTISEAREIHRLTKVESKFSASVSSCQALLLRAQRDLPGGDSR